MSAGLFRGVNASEDARFKNKIAKSLSSKHFPSEYNKPVDIQKVRIEVISSWINERITQLLGNEDDVVCSMIVNILQGAKNSTDAATASIDPRHLQFSLEGFLDQNAERFVVELWKLLLEAQSHPTGIPLSLIEQKQRALQEQVSNRTNEAIRIVSDSVVPSNTVSSNATSSGRVRKSRFGPPPAIPILSEPVDENLVTVTYPVILSTVVSPNIISTSTAHPPNDSITHTETQQSIISTVGDTDTEAAKVKAKMEVLGFRRTTDRTTREAPDSDSDSDASASSSPHRRRSRSPYRDSNRRSPDRSYRRSRYDSYRRDRYSRKRSRSRSRSASTDRFGRTRRPSDRRRGSESPERDYSHSPSRRYRSR